ncbi:radical SAM family heme chaperone HemW [Clostridium akagii]|uniref:radical SAM family heme chaperone HemW n=1 Tax=Clostridium akagii TaxID=91623 RepID=UPI00047AB71D|nr:radical SAM family heme chaperone HemW [Clostridium akagii]
MKEIALYIHIPFCKQKCLYCDFPSFCNLEPLMDDYIEALGNELRTFKAKNIIKTIFIGGGTPTYLNLKSLIALKKIISELRIDKDVEFTIEGNPGTFTEEKLEVLKSMGVNRLSIGLQAVQDTLLKKLGRIHSYEDFTKSYNLARNLGFDNINIDLMFGLPGQTMEMWCETLETVIRLKPEHLSCYSLILEEGTAFYKLYSEEDLPSEDNVLKMYADTKKMLKENSYYQYEISNFSKMGFQCKHNIVYWDLNSYIGVGSSAHSYYKGVRYRNEANVKKYIENIKNNESVIVEKYNNTIEDDMEEFMFLGLRKIQGISLEEFNKRFKKDIYDVYGDVINKYKKDKLIIENLGRMRLSGRGIEISNYVLSDFIIKS